MKITDSVEKLRNIQSDLQDKLETIHADLSITYETTSAVQASAMEGYVSGEQMDWILTGIARNMNKSVNDVGKIIEDIIESRKFLTTI